jgi:hypothetical protein
VPGAFRCQSFATSNSPTPCTDWAESAVWTSRYNHMRSGVISNPIGHRIRTIYCLSSCSLRRRFCKLTFASTTSMMPSGAVMTMSGSNAKGSPGLNLANGPASVSKKVDKGRGGCGRHSRRGYIQPPIFVTAPRIWP